MEEKESFKVRCKRLRANAYMIKQTIEDINIKNLCNFEMSLADTILKYKITEDEFKIIIDILLNKG